MLQPGNKTFGAKWWTGLYSLQVAHILLELLPLPKQPGSSSLCKFSPFHCVT